MPDKERGPVNTIELNLVFVSRGCTDAQRAADPGASVRFPADKLQLVALPRVYGQIQWLVVFLV
jgi:hypothetical protein